MILRSFRWFLGVQIFYLILVIDAQEKTYDDNDWIPITPSVKEKKAVEEKKAQARVLNIDAPAQNYFPEEYRKKTTGQQYLRETQFVKSPQNVKIQKSKPEYPYRFEPVLSYQGKVIQNQQKPRQQYIINQNAQAQTIQQPPPPPPASSVRQPQYIQQTQNPTFQQYILPPQPQFIQQQAIPQQQRIPQNLQDNRYSNIPVADANYVQQFLSSANSSYYPDVNPSAINTELLSALQNIKPLKAAPDALPNLQQPSTSNSPKPTEKEKESVQLLYVPLENLKANQPVGEGSQAVYNTANFPKAEKLVSNFPQTVSQGSQTIYSTGDFPRAERLVSNYPQPISQGSQTIYNTGDFPRAEKLVSTFPQPVYTQKQQHRLVGIEQDFVQQALQAQRLQEQIRNGQQFYYQPTSTQRPKKRKPHQPPLAVYMGGENNVEVDDVLDLLKNAKTISVQDTVTPNSPKVFIGPSSLQPPTGYTKFPLPYLNNLDGNRVERKIEQLPFFVAPLSYKTPNGYSKIPLPSPHVGSVVVSTKEDIHEKSRPIKPNKGNQFKPVQYIENPNINDNLKFEVPSTGRPQQYQIPSRPLPTTRNPQINYYLNQDEIVNGQQNIYDDVKQYQVATKRTPSLNLSSQDDKRQTLSQTTPSSTSRSTVDANPKTIVEGNIRQELTKEVVQNYEPISSSSPSTPSYSTNQQTYNVNPLELAINQFELQEINSQLVDKRPSVENPYYYETTNPGANIISSTPRYEEVYESSRTERPKSRRNKPTRGPPRTTQQIYDNTKYTVLEDFNVSPLKQTANYEATPESVSDKYKNSKTEIETIPSKVYKLSPPIQPVYTENRPSLNQHVLNQEILDQTILRTIDEESVTDEPPKIEPLVYNRGQQSQNDNENKNADQQTQILSGYLSNLQDQSVRSLLVPNLLVPTTEQEKEPATVKYDPVPSTEKEEVGLKVQSTEEPTIETTTVKRTRGRVRGSNSRFTTTSQPRRTVQNQRRRPNYARSTTPRPQTTSTEYNKVADTSSRRSISTGTKQRFRTRGRPVQNSITERISTTSTTENEVKTFNQPQYESGFQASTGNGNSQSYMQYEGTIDEQKIITVKPEDVRKENPIKDYHQVYSLSPQKEKTYSFKYENTDSQPTDSESDVINKSSEDQYVKYSSNVGGFSQEETHTKSPTRKIRPKSRFIHKPLTTSTTTTSTTEKPENGEFYGFFREPNFKAPQPITVELPEESTQLYSSTYQSSPASKTVYNEEFIAQGYSTEPSNLSQAPVRFVGQIRPKYQYSTPQYDDSSVSPSNQEDSNTESPKTKTRARTRLSLKKTQNDDSDQTTRRISTRLRNRGGAHYRGEKVRTTTDEADVEGGNYPVSYLASRSSTESPFQITVGPIQEEEIDQSPHSSYYSPQYAKPNSNSWVEASVLPPLNEIISDEKKSDITTTVEPLAMAYVNTEPEIALETTTLKDLEINTEQDIESITEARANQHAEVMSELLSEINNMKSVEISTEESVELKPTKKKGRRRGHWKLVKHRPIDNFETAESQNYESVLNSFDSIGKINFNRNTNEAKQHNYKDIPLAETVEYTTIKIAEDIVVTEAPTTFKPDVEEKEVVTSQIETVTTTTESTIFDTLYNMFGMKDQDEEEMETEKTPSTEPVGITEPATTTTAVAPTFPDEITDITTFQPVVVNATTELPKHIITTTTESVGVTENLEVAVSKTEPPKGVEPWQMRAVKTKVSTEVSHETEICYKGRCIKSLGKKNKTT